MRHVARIILGCFLSLTVSGTTMANIPFSTGTESLQNQAGAGLLNFQEPAQAGQSKIFKGEAVELRAKQLRKTNKGVARAMKEAEERGLKPAFDQGVIIILSSEQSESSASGGSALLNSPARVPASLAHALPGSMASPPQTYENGDSEITFFPYDDGNAATWEGVVYRAAPGAGEDTRYGEINIQTEPYVTLEIYYPMDGRRPIRTSYEARLPKSKDGSADRTAAPCKTPEANCKGDVSYLKANTTQTKIIRNMSTWVFCWIEKCRAYTRHCAMTGRWWSACFIGWCTVAAFECMYA